MRLLFAVNNLYFLKSHRDAVVRRAIESGWDVQIVSGPDESQRDIDARLHFTALGCPIHSVALTRAGMSLNDLWTTVAQLSRAYREIRPDVVHHITPKLVCLGSIAARLARVPNVVNAISGLGFMFSGQGFLNRTRAKAAGAVYFLSLRHPRQVIIVQNERDLAKLRALWLPSGTRFKLLRGSGVDLQRFRRTPLKPGLPVVVLASRLLRHKGVFEFVQAATMLKDRKIPVRMVICGFIDPSNPASLTSHELHLIEESGVVEFWGEQPDMAKVYSCAAIACLPSYYGEGLPLSLAEAAASGRAIVTTDIPGCRDTIVEGASGYTVPARDPAALAERLARLLQDRQLLEGFGMRARLLAEDRFSLDTIVAEHMEIYKSFQRLGAWRSSEFECGSYQ